MRIFSKAIDYRRERTIFRFFNIRISLKCKIKPPKNAISATKVLSNPERIKYNNKLATVFALYDKQGLVLENTLAYLKELKRYSDFVVVVSDCPMLPSEINKLTGVADAYILGRHNEYDFGSYKRGFCQLQNLNILQNIDHLILCNDSVVYNNVSIKDIINGVKSHDFFGVTINQHGYSKELILGDYAPHIQSYFVSVSKNIFEKQFFLDFINSIKTEQNKESVIYNYEQGLSRVITANGFELNSFYPIRGTKGVYEDPCCYYLNNSSDYNGTRIFIKKWFIKF